MRNSPARAALVLLALAAGGCEQTASLAREKPGKDSPFAAYGYRNLTPAPVPSTEIPNEKLQSYVGCVTGTEERRAAQWVRDWFAAVSSLDQCDGWALDVLSSPDMRSNLVFILERSQRQLEAQSPCRNAAFDIFTSIEETHSLLAGWRNGLAHACDRARLKEVADQRDRAFTEKIASVQAGIERFKNQ